MKIALLFLLSAFIARAAVPIDPVPGSAPSYFEKWSMVKMWPQPQEPLTEEKVAEVKRGDRTSAYTIAHYNPAGRLWTVEELVGAKRKVKFAYVYDDSGQVIRIDLFLSDGVTKTYYDRFRKPPPKK